jgi:catechol 2,3-dioxygenase-like lactoylglutathione lyase family enzyme
MGVETISAITLAVVDMARSVVFYRDHVGLELLYGGEGASFTSFRVGDSFVNLTLSEVKPAWWGRLIFHVDDVDAHYERLRGFDLKPSTAPADARWGERYFHIDDPDGHELSFATPLPQGRST